METNQKKNKGINIKRCSWREITQAVNLGSLSPANSLSRRRPLICLAAGHRRPILCLAAGHCSFSPPVMASSASEPVVAGTLIGKNKPNE